MIYNVCFELETLEKKKKHMGVMMVIITMLLK